MDSKIEYYITVSERSGKLIGTGLYKIKSQVILPGASLYVQRTTYETTENTKDYPQKIIIYEKNKQIIDIVCISGNSITDAKIDKVMEKKD